MKCIVAFLVLSMVVLMAEPGECFWHHVAQGVGHILSGLGNAKQRMEDQQEQLDKRAVDYYQDQPN